MMSAISRVKSRRNALLTPLTLPIVCDTTLLPERTLQHLTGSSRTPLPTLWCRPQMTPRETPVTTSRRVKDNILEMIQ